MQFMCFLNSVPSIFKSSQIRLLGISCLSSQWCSYMTMHWKLPQVQIAEVNKKTALLWSPFVMGIQGSDVHHVKNVISKMIIFLQHCVKLCYFYIRWQLLFLFLTCMPILNTVNAKKKQKTLLQRSHKHNDLQCLHACLSIHQFFTSHLCLYLNLTYTKSSLAYRPHLIFL